MPFATALALATLARAQSSCGAGWAQSFVAGPAERSGHAMAYDAVNLRSVVVGGTILGVFTSEMWRYNGSWLSITSSPRPSGRDGAAMVYDSSRQRLILFSGFSGMTGAGTFGGYENATWELTSSGWVVRALTGPAPRAGHVMCYVPSPTNRTLLFGGSNRPNLQVPTTRFSDTWEWNATNSTWTQLNVVGPSARDFAAMAFDSTRRVGVLFGGLSVIVGNASDTWEWNADARTWTQISIPGPSPRHNTSLVFDSARNVCVLFGGSTGLSVSDTWQYSGVSGGAWSRLITPAAPPRRDSQGMVYDSFRGRVVLFGGQAGFNYLGDTWEADLANWPIVYSRPLPTTVFRGCTATFAVAGGAPPLSRPLSYQWRLNSVPLVDDGRVSGSQTDTLTIAAVSDTDAGGYDVVLSSICGSALSTPADLSIIDASSITDQPLNAQTCPAGSASFTVGVTGSISPTYQWQWQPDPADPTLYDLVDGDVMDPATGLEVFSASGSLTSTLSVSLPAFLLVPAFSCTITDGCNSVSSNSATLTINSDAPTIAPTGQPQPAALCPEQNASFIVAATTSTPASNTYRWQWQPSGPGTEFIDLPLGTISNASGEPCFVTEAVDGPALSITRTALDEQYYKGYNLRCIVTSDCGGDITSDSALFTLDAAPVIAPDGQPQSVQVCSTATATFTVTTDNGVGGLGESALSYQWQIEDTFAVPAAFIELVDGPIVLGGTLIGTSSGATERTWHTVLVASAGGTNRVRCIVGSACGSATSDSATLTIQACTTCPADFNQDGELNPDDLADYIGAYFAQPAGAGSDFNLDGETNPDDLADYIGAFFAGC